MAATAESLQFHPKFTTIGEAARYAIDASDNDRTQATQLLRDILAQDDKTYMELVEPLILSACRKLVLEAIGRSRTTLWNTKPPEQPPVDDSARLHSACKQQLQRTIMDYNVMDRVTLGAATKEDLMTARKILLAQASTAVTRAKWFKLMADKLKGKQTVAEVLDENTILAMKERCGLTGKT